MGPVGPPAAPGPVLGCGTGARSGAPAGCGGLLLGGVGPLETGCAKLSITSTLATQGGPQELEILDPVYLRLSKHKMK